MKTSCLLVPRLACLLAAFACLGKTNVTAGSAPIVTNVTWIYQLRTGSNATLQVGVSGTPPLFYQWQRSGTNVVGATNSSYIFTPVHCRDSASFGIAISNEFGIYTLSPRSVTVFGCLQELINAAAPGTTLTLPETTFDDNVTIDKDLTLEGIGPDYTTLFASYRANALIIRPNIRVTLRRLNIQGGIYREDGCYTCPALGAGIHNFGDLMVDQCVISGVSGYTGSVGNSGTMIVSNSVIGGGGDAITAIKNSGSMFLWNTRIQGTYASDDGGDTTIDNGGTIVFNDCVISDNRGKRTSYSCIANSGTMLMTNVVVANNVSGAGGGIRSGGILVLSRCSIYGNQASFHGIGAVENWGRAIIEKTTIRNHNSGDGYPGGVANRRGSFLTMIDSEISGNSAYYFPYTESVPGGLYNASGATGVLVNCTINGNESVRGGAGIGNSGMLALTNCTVSDNGSLNGSGGIRNHGVITLTSCTVFGNHGQNGGGLVNLYSATIHNTVFASNSDDISGTINSLGYNLIQSTNGATISNILTGNLYGVDPLLGSLQYNGGPTRTHALLPGSPAIDAGPPTDFPSTDQRGILRPVDGNGDGIAMSDIGAFELVRLTFAAVERTTDGQLRLRISGGAPGQSCTIEGSDNLKTWTPLATLLVDPNRWITAHVSFGQAQHFFRVAAP